ncbi:unnamed protein product [Kluyveromyces dobzhanskii CBS 2104]|uniref:WGS project CCBQ000000000 data, contig MAT n=1 Tax=Kluyveromyces dobzhanskii CBS 2104 TaxID=1427455 RepID=A0A0A8L1B2_9SACH|nr:unnamed protein product [Kluyveromyces dobzhanskii CBS 2104]
MSYNTTPLFGRQSVVSQDEGSEFNVSPTQPLDLRTSIIQAQKRASSHTIRVSTIAQRLTNDSKHVSVQSTNTYTSNDTFLTANSQEVPSQTECNPASSHPFSAFTRSRENVLDLDATPIVKQPVFIDATTPKITDLRTHPEKEESSNEGQQMHGLGLIRPIQAKEVEYNTCLSASEDEEGNTTHEFTFDTYGKFAHNGTLISAGDTILSNPALTEAEEHETIAEDKKTNSPDVIISEENLAYLFIIAVHSFNVSSLENPEDAAICISFEKDDVAFVHSVDESGWGEVTLIKNMQKGWVPFNYFADAVKQKNKLVIMIVCRLLWRQENLLSSCCQHAQNLFYTLKTSK